VPFCSFFYFKIAIVISLLNSFFKSTFDQTVGFADNVMLPFCVVFVQQHQVCIIPSEEFAAEYLRPQVKCIATYGGYVNQR